MTWPAYAQYAGAFREIADELLAELSESERECAAAWYRESGADGVVEWAAAHYQDVVDYVRTSPSARRRLKRWAAYPERHALVLASRYWLSCAFSLLHRAESAQMIPGMSYRNAAAHAIRLCMEGLLEDGIAILPGKS